MNKPFAIVTGASSIGLESAAIGAQEGSANVTPLGVLADCRYMAQPGPAKNANE